ncbi:hypothetical protein C8J55DRAFT_495584 [Lentinula edodes]|uniref:Uncharacterized protein n=1 Tax=Lentinula lateritia TaxID=40482 RepID=A0A9W9B1I2_9AGAR|nr:hypothetical protein C8J55DRAFT_495584 [Lentinula edodes]
MLSYIMICCGNTVSHSLTLSFLPSLEIIWKLLHWGPGQFYGTSYATIFPNLFYRLLVLNRIIYSHYITIPS